MITDCRVDEARLAPLRECMETYGQEGNDATNEWPWNCLSRRTVAYTCGALRRGEEPAVHNHDEAEFALCRKLANEAAKLMEGVEVGMGSESQEYFAPFYIVASVGTDNPHTLDAETIRAAFGGTIYPAAEITLEPLTEQAKWWQVVVMDIGEEEEEEQNTAEEDFIRPWRSLMQWFHRQPEFKQTALVMIGDSPLDDENGASVFPRLAVGLTQAGSIVGIAGVVVHT